MAADYRLNTQKRGDCRRRDLPRRARMTRREKEERRRVHHGGIRLRRAYGGTSGDKRKRGVFCCSRQLNAAKSYKAASPEESEEIGNVLPWVGSLYSVNSSGRTVAGME